MSEYHGDEDWIDSEAKTIADEYENEHADDWKDSDKRLGYID